MKTETFEITGIKEWLAVQTRTNAYLANDFWKPFTLIFKFGSQRSIKQNKLIHALFEDCAKLSNMKDASWWKEELKLKIGRKEVHFDMHDQPHVIVISTTEYSIPEAADFAQKLQAYMKVNYNVDIDLPEDLKMKQFLEQGAHNDNSGGT